MKNTLPTVKLGGGSGMPLRCFASNGTRNLHVLKAPGYSDQERHSVHEKVEAWA